MPTRRMACVESELLRCERELRGLLVGARGGGGRWLGAGEGSKKKESKSKQVFVWIGPVGRSMGWYNRFFTKKISLSEDDNNTLQSYGKKSSDYIKAEILITWSVYGHKFSDFTLAVDGHEMRQLGSNDDQDTNAWRELISDSDIMYLLFEAGLRFPASEDGPERAYPDTIALKKNSTDISYANFMYP
jgi:hypothetical protein